MANQHLEPNESLEELRHRLAEAEETIRAIREGDVDALLIAHPTGDRLYTLHTADAPYRAFVEQMQEGAVTLTPAGQITYCNRRFAELAGTRLEQVIGAPIERLLAEEPDRSVLRDLIQSGSGVMRARLRHASGAMREIRLSVATASLVGESLRTVIVTDLSTIAKAQRESREKDEFLAMLAHELRNPLGAIAGAIQVFNLVELADARAALARGVIERQVSHMARLIDDLLEVGRVVTGKIAIDHRPVDLSECVKSSVAAARAGQHADRNIELDVEPAWVMGDAVRLEQVASNLIANALRFTTSGQRVRVSVEADHGDAVLRVSDEGAGIEPDLLPRIFELFVQADRTRDRFKGGLGIGLTLVKRLVDLHGGIVAAASDGPGRGATFTVRLPRVAAPRDRLTTGAAAAAGSGLRVLLVDDNADARGMYALILKSDGHEVHQAADGISGLEVFRRTAPLVAVVDIGLPGMDGYEFARQLRAEPSGRDVRLIALTGYGFPEDRERSRAAGFDSHLVKPVTPDELRQQLSAVRDNVAR